MAGGKESRSYTGEMPDPTITAAREIIEESIEGIRGAISGLGADALNWRPSEEGTNPIAVLAVHAMHCTRSWLAVAMGALLPDRDRDAEFLLTTEDAFEPGAMRESHFRASSERAEMVSGAWALLHTVEHLREHMGHAQLTRQLWDHRVR